MLNLSQYLVKERAGMMKFADTYDIFDPATNQQVGIALEKPGAMMHMLRLAINKQTLPTTIHVAAQENGPPMLTIKRGFKLLRSRVTVFDGSGAKIGYFVSKLMTIGGAFQVFDSNDNKVAEVKGDWKGGTYKFTADDGEEIGLVTKQWAGMGKELFTSADNYVISLSGVQDPARAALLLAAGLAVDIIYNED